MTFQSYRLLRKLKKAQVFENGQVIINRNALTASSSRDKREPHVTVDLSKYQHSLNSVLAYLESEGMVLLNPQHPAYVKLTHAGWYWQQTVTAKIGKFLLNSIAVVSVLTTLITLWVTNAFR